MSYSRLACLLPPDLASELQTRVWPWLGETYMDGTYGATCLMCGRDLGCIVQGKFYARPGASTLERVGRQYRCGYCQGNVLFEPDSERSQPHWIAAMRRGEAADSTPRRAVRRRAG